MCKIHDNWYYAMSSRSPLPLILLTGFEAFGDDPGDLGVNPSALVAKALHGKRIAKHRVVSAVLPCVFGQSLDTLLALIDQHRPRLVVCLGQAGGRSGISLERIAVNLDDANIPDNAGIAPKDQVIVPGAPTAYFSSLPVKAMLDALHDAGIACELSSSAGHFVCNHVFYGLMHACAQRSKTRTLAINAGFIHIPYLPEQALRTGISDMPSMSQDRMEHAITRCLAIATQTLAE